MQSCLAARTGRRLFLSPPLLLIFMSIATGVAHGKASPFVSHVTVLPPPKDLPNKEALLDVSVDFIASCARVGASARQNSEIKCVHCSDSFEPLHTFNPPTTNRSLGNTQCELIERREHPEKSACIRVVASSRSRPWAHCSSLHRLCTRSAHRRLPPKVPLRKFRLRKFLPPRHFLRPLLPHQCRLSLRRPPRLLFAIAITTNSGSRSPVRGRASGSLGRAERHASSGLRRPSIGGDLLPRQLSYTRMFLDADWVVKAVMIGLAFASLVSWTVWLAKTWELARARPRGAPRRAHSARSRRPSHAHRSIARRRHPGGDNSCKPRRRKSDCPPACAATA